MRVLVTGATGYVGRAVVRELRVHGHEPVLSRQRMSEPFESPDVDAVIHLAAVARVRESFEDPLSYYETNVAGTLNLLKALKGQRFLLASTGTVYRPSDSPLTEESVREPSSPYSASKAAAEDLVAWAARSGQIGATTLRLFNVAGGGDTDTSRVITRAVACAAGTVPGMEVYGDGGAVRDFVHVRDVAAAFVVALEACSVGTSSVYNVAATPASVQDVLAAVAEVTGRTVDVTWKPAHPGEARSLRADVSKLRALGWEPRSSALTEIVRDQWLSSAPEPGPGPSR
ncbi:NAD-dependent epimerase/dehydratase family protein [Lentzea sp. BCCO 10_0856]|uniref:NAD-dependent epimerase/dehydratase family protein n=1 Tax=Lentzea miocenica TaxID=3095431 RepID=A0ABU4T2A7_9PSEU|nr:NAD-dependent epimerase/dehydratase family protein [Lentzea sp. BCCO 10_0856]MDX8032298.1 NAD-dependent epimerase/dehydratase family protein [Lentzea sp. BCCO 10_0856]